MQVLFSDFVQPNLDLEAQLLSEAGLPMKVSEPQCQTAEDVIAACGESEAIISLYAPMTDEVFTALPRLRIVSVPLVGVDAIDLDAAKKHGVWVAHVPDAWVSEVGVHAAAMALSMVRHLPFYDRSVREGRWDYEEPGVLHRPSELTFGVLGCGRIGRMAARVAASCFGRVIGYDPFIPDGNWPAGIERLENLQEFLGLANVVTLHMPLTPDSHHLLNHETLGQMRPGSYLVNASRGALVDPAALLSALDSGQLAGAALDVLEQEPPDPKDPLLSHPRTLISPHAAYYSLEADEEGRARAVKNVTDFAATGRPTHVVVEGHR